MRVIYGYNDVGSFFHNLETLDEAISKIPYYIVGDS